MPYHRALMPIISSSRLTTVRAHQAFDKTFDASVARTSIEDALAGKEDVDLANSFASLARERQVPLDPDLTARVDDVFGDICAGRRLHAPTVRSAHS